MAGTITISLYTISDDKEHIDKTLGTPTTLSNCTIKEQTSVQDPVLRIQTDTNLSGFNYAYIDRYNRYYYIRKVETTPTGFWVLSLHSDVLMSRKEQIRELRGTVTRSESVYNAYLNDSQYKALAYRKTVTKAFPNAMEEDTFILMTVGGVSV